MFDGGFGTYYSQKYEEPSHRCEIVNIKYPQRVVDIHKEYICAGADAIKTNTFGAFFENYGNDYINIIKTGYNLAIKAKEECNSQVDIFADLGPVVGDEIENQVEEYIKTIDVFFEIRSKEFPF